jgi:hypothetical protein
MTAKQRRLAVIQAVGNGAGVFDKQVKLLKKWVKENRDPADGYLG